MARDLSTAVQACLEAATYGVNTYDADSLAEAARDNVFQEADNACIYYSHCMGIISEYESEYGKDAEDLGGSFKAEDWQQAMQAYAYSIANVAIDAMLGAELEAIEEKAEALREASGNDDLSTSRDCPFGWLAHLSETADGVCYWPNVEGSGPRWAIAAGAFWLWTGPEAT